ncbi:MAG: 1-acyl-sn-glycerol-3-phosphate acyltransferase [Verrucomicrobiota bacterium]
MTATWYRCCHWLCARIYYERITVLHPERVPAEGPVLFIGLHRNGAVDGFIYHQVVPRGVYMVSTQLLRSFFARLFFGGIAVARKKDREDAGQNEKAMRDCVELLDNGGALILFPEGTSTLGPRHLPFKSGAAHIAVDAIANGILLRIVPLGIHYERAWAFRSKVEVVVGKSISTEFPEGPGELGKLKEMKRRMSSALEQVGVNFVSEEDQKTAECLAYASTLGTERSYFASLKALEPGVPDSLRKSWDGLCQRFSPSFLLRHQNVPLYPGKAWIIYAIALLILGPLVLAGMVVNFPPLALGWIAGWKLADDRNVIALWRLMVGLPVFLIWLVMVVVLLTVFSNGWWSAGYVLLTVVSLETIYRTKKVAVSVWNGLFYQSIAKPAWNFHKLLADNLPPE